MSDTDQKVMAWLRLTRVAGVGPRTGARLVERFGSAEAVFGADAMELMRVEGMRSATAKAVRGAEAREAAERDGETCRAKGIKVVAFDDPAYPAALKEIEDAPLVLFVRGELTAADEDGVAMVGSRNPDAYGRSIAVSIAAGLAKYGMTVVSGLALGIDGAAQGAAVKAGGRSVAVLGTGVDVIYPPEHEGLYAAVMEAGAVVSEFPPGTEPKRENFPRRNRVISGLARGVIMVQAMSEHSGALITVRQAWEQGREVFAVPGNAGSRGGRVGNGLIKQGAKLVESADDVAVHLKPLGTVALVTEGEKERALDPRAARLPDLQAKIYALVPAPEDGEIDVDSLIRQAGTSIAELQGALLALELSGLIRTVPGSRYVRSGPE
jgi:DNA processing protein